MRGSISYKVADNFPAKTNGCAKTLCLFLASRTQTWHLYLGDQMMNTYRYKNTAFT